MNGRSLSSSYMLQMLAAKAPPPPPTSAPPAATTAAAVIAAVVSAAQDADSAAAAAVAAKPPAPIVQVSLAIPTLTADKLYPTPSMADHLAFDVEFDLRLVGCELIQTAGRLLQMPQVFFALFCIYINIVILFIDRLFCRVCNVKDRNGHGSSALPSLLLLQVVCEESDGVLRHGVHIP